MSSFDSFMFVPALRQGALFELKDQNNYV